MSNELINIEGTEETPSVKQEGSGDSCTIMIWGISMPENTLEFYVPLIEQLTSKCVDVKDLTFVFHLDYMNSMSNKQILKLITMLSKGRNKFSVIWKYNAGDELIKLKGEEMRSILENIPFDVQGS